MSLVTNIVMTQLKHIKAFHPRRQVVLRLEFVSIAQAKYHNPNLVNFEYV